MKLNQISVKYDPEEDRLLLRMNTDSEEEFKFYLTRRIIKQLIPLMNKYFDKEQENVSANVMLDSKKEIKEFQHSKMLEDVKFTNEYKEAPKTDQPDKPPILVSKVIMKSLEENKIRLGFFPKEKEGLEFVTNLKFLHSLYQLIINASKRSEWGLVAQRAEPSSPPEDASKETNNERKH